MNKAPIQVIVLAAGKGTRMHSPKPKVLFRIGGQPILHKSILLARSVSPINPIVIIPADSPSILHLSKKLSTQHIPDQLQIGNATSFALALKYTPLSISQALVLNADDSYLYTPKDILDLIATHNKNNFSATILATHPQQPYPSIRKLKVTDQRFDGFLPSDHSGPISCGCYVINIDWAKKFLPSITPNPKNNEYQITSLFELGVNKNQPIGISYLHDSNHWWGINTKSELKVARKLWKKLNP